MKYSLVIIVLIVLGALAFWQFQNRSFPLPSGETTVLTEQDVFAGSEDLADGQEGLSPPNSEVRTMRTQREIFLTDGVKHSIPLREILSGGPGKDGIPSIDNPKFWTRAEADATLAGSDIGLGLEYKGEARFYPFRILVWHEIVNDTVAGDPLLVTYCPLCQTGIVFERRVNGQEQEFGVSGMLWQSNLLMYNRAPRTEDESLWSQVLGEAVLGPNTGEKLRIVTSDIVRWDDWKRVHPNTVVLNTETGASRNYARDPYGDYYTSNSVSFGATFRDDRLHPKALVVGVELGGRQKAYHVDALPVGSITDTVGGHAVEVAKDSAGRVRVTSGGEEVPAVWGFWFSWIAVHPHTDIFIGENL